MSAIYHLAMKDLVLLWRDRMGLFWILGWPLVFALFFGALFGGGGGETGKLSVALVDADGSEASAQYVAALEESDGLELSSYDDVELARDAVRKGDEAAYLLLKEGFGDGMGPLFGAGEVLEVGVDPSRKAEAGFLQGMLMEAAFKSTVERLRDPEPWRAEIQAQIRTLRTSEALGVTQSGVLLQFLQSTDEFLADFDTTSFETEAITGGAALEVVDVVAESDGPSSSWQITFPSATLWGVLAVAAGLAITLVREHGQGTWSRLVTSPLSRGGILAGKGLACFAACVFVQCFILSVGWLALGVEIARPLSLFVAIPSVAFAFSGLMMLLSTLGRTEQAVSGAAWGVLMIFAMLGGGMIPLLFMPSWMQTLSTVSPVRWGIVALEGAIWRDFGIAEMATSCGVLVAIGMVAGGIGWRVMSARAN